MKTSGSDEHPPTHPRFTDGTVISEFGDKTRLKEPCSSGSACPMQGQQDGEGQGQGQGVVVVTATVVAAATRAKVQGQERGLQLTLSIPLTPIQYCITCLKQLQGHNNRIGRKEQKRKQQQQDESCIQQKCLSEQDTRLLINCSSKLVHGPGLWSKTSSSGFTQTDLLFAYP